MHVQWIATSAGNSVSLCSVDGFHKDSNITAQLGNYVPKAPLPSDTLPIYMMPN